jgi:hypothetical protein
MVTVKKIIIVRFLLALLVSIMIGCESLSKKECLNANWRLIGFEDGSQGKQESTIGAHRKACAKVSVTPDLEEYQRGHREGARKYCVKTTAYNVGVSGGAYYGVCPADLEPGFLKAYQTGQELYNITRQIAAVQADIDRYDEDIHALEADIAEHEKIIVDAASSSKTRREQLRIIDDLRYQITGAELNIAGAEQELRALQMDYQHVQNQHRKMGY